jgi:phosphatidylglycerol:prolipoprotein diacylglycerol transferase
LFGVCYGAFRFIVEFARQPDADIGFIAFEWLTMGQLLSLPMIIIGAGMIAYGYRRHPVTN